VVTEGDWRDDPVVAQLDADAHELFDSKYAPRLANGLKNGVVYDVEVFRSLFIAAYSSGFARGLEYTPK
jgi:hypothetical protein